VFATPLNIGPVPLRTNLLLAPIAGYCDLAFRTVCREWGGVGLACTDLLSPQGLLRGTATSLDLAKTNDFDKPVGMQLYGSDPDIMAEGARWAVEHGATVVDINMGCPVDKVTKKDGGSKLLTNIEGAVKLAQRVARELEKCPISADEWQRRLGSSSSLPECRIPNAESRSSFTVPLTCKIRLCWHTADFDAGLACSPHLARMLADVGVVAVTVHGRTTEDKFQGSVRREGIARVVEAVNGRIPIIGNGDVREPEDAAQMIRETGCQGVMIGRGALSTPWLFRDAWHYLQTGQRLPEPTEAEKIATIRRFFDLMLHQRDERYAMFQIRRRISWFAKRLQRQLDNGKMESVKPLKEAMRTAAAPADVHAILDRFLNGELRGGWFEAEAALGSADAE
jgi:tRNA-dihydrouridine synthase